MRFVLEELECRAFFSGTPIPPAVAAAYAAIIQDDAKLKADMKTLTGALKASVKDLGKAVKALGKNDANAALMKSIVEQAGLVVSNDSDATNTFVKIANPTYKKTELAEAAFAAKPSLDNGHKLVAQVNACSALQNAFTDPRFAPQIQAAADAAGQLGDALAALGSGNSGASTVLIKIQAVVTALDNVNTVQSADGEACLAAIPVLLQTEPG